MENDEELNNPQLPDTKKDITPRQLVEDTFKELGFTNENPDDLDLVTEILNIWRNPEFDDSDPDFSYTQEQYILLNDPDVMNVLNRCMQYYEPKRHLTKGDLRQILEDIALGRTTRKDYDFKNGEPVDIEPTFAERIQAIKMLQEGADDKKASTVQFVNNIISSDNTLPVQPNLNAPTEPPEGHYSLNLEPDLEPDPEIEVPHSLKGEE